MSDFGIVPDDFQMTCSMLVDAAAGHDLILTSGGVSVGEEDHVRAAIEAEGKCISGESPSNPGNRLYMVKSVVHPVSGEMSPLSDCLAIRYPVM